MRARGLAACCVGLFLALVTARADVTAGQRAYDRGDYATAFSEWRASAQLGIPEAQFRLGQLYRDGRGVQKDMLEFAYLWSQAALHGHRKAAAAVGWPITPANAPRLTCSPSKSNGSKGQIPRVRTNELLDLHVTLHNTRLMVEQMVLHANNYTAGYEPKRPNLEVRAYRLDGQSRPEVPVTVDYQGGEFSGPYGDDARRGHIRKQGVFDETIFVSIRIPLEEEERRANLRQNESELEKLVEAGKASPQLLEALRNMAERGPAPSSSFFPSRRGKYEITLEYVSQDARFWPGRVSTKIQFEFVD